MRTLLLALALTFTATAAFAQDFDWRRDFGVWTQPQQAAVVEQHPKANEPVDITKLSGPLPAYLAQQTLRGAEYIQWALTWNAYHDEVANRAAKTRVLFGETTTTTNTTTGTVTNRVPRLWFQHQGVPGKIRYNPFVAPSR